MCLLLSQAWASYGTKQETSQFYRSKKTLVCSTTQKQFCSNITSRCNKANLILWHKQKLIQSNAVQESCACYFIQVQLCMLLHTSDFPPVFTMNYYLKCVTNVNSYPKWTVIVACFLCNNKLVSDNYQLFSSQNLLCLISFSDAFLKWFRKPLHCTTFCNKEKLLSYQPLFRQRKTFASFWFSFLSSRFKNERTAR